MLKLMLVAPLVGAVLLALTGKRLSERIAGAVACLSVAVSTFAAFAAFFADLLGTIPGPDGIARVSERIGTWIEVGTFRADLGLTLDPLSGVMVLFVTGVGLLIHIFATGYMHGDPGFHRFFAYMNLFMFAMLTLLLADNFLLMFVGWEGVGVCSYLLIGYYFLRREAGDAAKKAFVVNRIGDFGLVLGVLLVFLKAGSINFQEVMAWASAQPVETLGWAAVTAGGTTTIALLLFVGATGKSAQIPLFTWLPDAMAGPTPVSALIHAATMVTAGVYLVARCNAIFTKAPTALLVVAVIGAVTAIVAATIGLGQWDIKKVLAYSTVSQLGYMFLACGVGAYSAAIFHVMTHAFFKALLFLGSGSVIHGLHEEQDLRRMGGLKQAMPTTRWTMTAGWLAIAGFPLLAGFFSKDEILWRTFSTTALPGAVGKLLWGVGIATAALTAIYMTRLMVLTFEGDRRGDAKAHESPLVMTVPLMILAVLSVIGGFVGVPQALGGSNRFEHFLQPVIVGETATHAAEGGHGLELGLTAASVAVALAGLAIGWSWFRKNPLWTPPTLLQAKYYVDELYDAAIVKPIETLSREGLWKIVETRIVDGAVTGLGRSVGTLGETLRYVQSGFARTYAAFILVGAVIVIGYFFMSRP